MTSACGSQGSAASVRGIAQSRCLKSEAPGGGPPCTLRTWICRGVDSLLGSLHFPGLSESVGLLLVAGGERTALESASKLASAVFVE